MTSTYLQQHTSRASLLNNTARQAIASPCQSCTSLGTGPAAYRALPVVLQQRTKNHWVCCG